MEQKAPPLQHSLWSSHHSPPDSHSVSMSHIHNHLHALLSCEILSDSTHILSVTLFPFRQFYMWFQSSSSPILRYTSIQNLSCYIHIKFPQYMSNSLAVPLFDYDIFTLYLCQFPTLSINPFRS